MVSRILVTVLFCLSMTLFVLSMGTDSPVVSQTIDTTPSTVSKTVVLDASGNSGGPLDAYSNLTALGILGTMSLFIVLKMLPALHKQFMEQANNFNEQLALQNRVFAESMASQSRTFAETISKANEAIADNTRSVNDMRTHCAEVQAKRG